MARSSTGASSSGLPFAQASKERPGGLYLGAKPSALSAMSGNTLGTELPGLL